MTEVSLCLGSTECEKRKGRGDCSNLCTTNQNGQSCLCDYGVAMHENGKTCADGNSSRIISDKTTI